MKNNYRIWGILLILLVLLVQCRQPAFDEKLDLSGGWNFENYRIKAEEFATTLLAHGRDHYGINTPLFLAMLNLKTRQKVMQKDPLWERDYDYEDYMRNANGSNLARDFATLGGLYHLSNLTGNESYRRAANDYLTYFLAHCVSPTTGLFAYGEHMSYNVVRDTVEHHRHELEIPIPLLTEMWRLAPDVMQRYTEAIWNYHIYDKETFFYDRHGNYYTGEFDDLSVRGAWIKHAGLYANIFIAAYAQTGQTKYLDWARKISAIYSEHAHPKTGLVTDNLLDQSAVVCSQNPLLAWYLLKTSQFADDNFILIAGMNFLRAFTEYAYNPADQTFYAGLSIADGKPAASDRQAIWESIGPAIITARACVLAFRKSEEKFFLDRALKYATYIRNNAPTSTTPPGNIGNAIQFFLDMYEVNQASLFLNEARKLAQYAIANYFENGLIKASPDGFVYSAKSGAGELFAALVNLYEIETNLDFHWKAPDVVRAGSQSIPFELQMKTPTAVSMDYTFGTDSVRTLKLTSAKKSNLSFKVPVANSQFDGVCYFYFYNPEKSLMSGAGEILIDDDLDGPQIQHIHFERVLSTACQAEIRATITDPKGIKQAVVKYRLGSSLRTVLPDTIQGSEYHFHIAPPAQLPVTLAEFWLEAEDADNFPAKTSSPHFSLQWKLEKKLKPEKNLTEMMYQSPDLSLKLAIPDAPELPEISAHLFHEVKEAPGKMIFTTKTWEILPVPIPIGSRLILKFEPEDVNPLQVEKMKIMFENQGNWEVLPSKLNRAESSIEAVITAAGKYSLAGPPRVFWRQTFDGALLCSPAIADLNADGRPEIVLDSRDIDRKLYCLSPAGERLWEYPVNGMTFWPLVADLDGNPAPEIIFSSDDHYLYVLSATGQLKWRRKLGEKPFVPAVGTLIPGEAPKIIAPTLRQLFCLSASGEIVWEFPLESKPYIPVLADLDGDERLEIILGQKNGKLIILNAQGESLLEKTFSGFIESCPLAADFDGDGAVELVVHTRDQHLHCLTPSGEVKWQLPASSRNDWSPVAADWDADGYPDVIFQGNEPGTLLVANGRGEILRQMRLPGAYSLTPVVVDLDGDGKPDLLTEAEIGYPSRYFVALANSGEMLWSFRKPDWAKFGGSPAVADLDGDGTAEVLFGTDGTALYALHSGAPCLPFAVLNAMFRGDGRHSGVY